MCQGWWFPFLLFEHFSWVTWLKFFSLSSVFKLGILASVSRIVIYFWLSSSPESYFSSVCYNFHDTVMQKESSFIWCKLNYIFWIFSIVKKFHVFVHYHKILSVLFENMSSSIKRQVITYLSEVSSTFDHDEMSAIISLN